MKVYILQIYDDVVDVFATRELAEEACRLCDMHPSCAQEWDVSESLPEDWLYRRLGEPPPVPDPLRVR